ncbi:hypothetical protein C477_22740 [Haloterrigena salina JCM 13891]|uniref:Uncharacterized protein n=2 Tax=Haloterrigena salina TaxID=504937 RepID=M0BT81_9EURY|nr:hypothetical protein C477_22740 [Haloterrigena salina JCM 13891]
MQDMRPLDYSHLEDGEAFILELVTPFVLQSEYRKANNVDVPWWWSVDDEAQLRQQLEKVIEGATSTSNPNSSGTVENSSPVTSSRSNRDYEQGTGGVHLEELVEVTETSYENLTDYPHEFGIV